MTFRNICDFRNSLSCCLSSQKPAADFPIFAKTAKKIQSPETLCLTCDFSQFFVMLMITKVERQLWIFFKFAEIV